VLDIFKFIDAERTSFPIAFMCHRLGVSKAAYYAWKDRPLAKRAVADARITRLIHQIYHSCQYTSLALRRRCRKAGIAASMGSVGYCFDNAMCESFFASFEC
jgi:transposase InsO family protein